MRKRVAVLGASGFIGSRTVEMMYLNEWAVPRAVVRRSSGLALSKRFSIDGAVADGFDQLALQAAFAGCDAVVHAIAGDPRTITGTIEPVYRAAQSAGVRRLVYLSSASVHGQSPKPGTSEESPLNDRQPIEYNNSKVRAERRLLQLRGNGSVEVVLLRPGIVFGPRSSWTGGLADDLEAGVAYLVDGGTGICNSAYIDNLVHAINLALTAPAADRHAYIIGDSETVTWADLYRPIVEAFGYDIQSLTCSAPAEFRSGMRGITPKAGRVLRNIARHLPKPVYQLIKATYAARNVRQTDREESAEDHGGRIIASEERVLLHRCDTKLSFEKARRELGYSPIVSFAEGCRRSVAWLEFAGYRVQNVEGRRYAAGSTGE